MKAPQDYEEQALGVLGIGTVFVVILTLAMAARATSQCAPCDVNGDGLVGVASDYMAFFAAYGKKPGQAGYTDRADFNGDGLVSGADHAALVKFCPLQ